MSKGLPIKEFTCRKAIPEMPWQTLCGAVGGLNGSFHRRMKCNATAGFIMDCRPWDTRAGTRLCEKHARAFAAKHGIEIGPGGPPRVWRGRIECKSAAPKVDWQKLCMAFPGGEGCKETSAFVIRHYTTLGGAVRQRDIWVCNKHAEGFAAEYGIEIQPAAPAEDPQVWRSRGHKYYGVDVDILRHWLKRDDPEGGQQHFRVKVDLRTEEGFLTTWLRTEEIRAALAADRIIKCHKANLSVTNLEHQARWQQVRNQILRRFGRRCMRCGRTDGKIELDHIKPWKTFPEGRYDPENLQLLCGGCHASKHQEESMNREWPLEATVRILCR
jgi:hypothetical protein